MTTRRPQRSVARPSAPEPSAGTSPASGSEIGPATGPGHAPSPPAPGWADRAATALTLALVALLTAWHLRDLGAGALQFYDEFYTYERSLGFLDTGDWWAVQSLGAPSLKKPPLQYWMSAGLIAMGVEHLWALRLPSVIFAAATLLATAALARLMMPGRPWMMPAAVVLLASSTQFWRSSTSAMLDAGAAFFSTLGIIAILAALRDPRRWALLPLSVFAAGLQKAPTPLAFLVFALAAVALSPRVQPIRFGQILRDRRFLAALGLSLVLGFAWQIGQTVRFWGEDRLAGDVEHEMFRRFAPSVEALLAQGLASAERLILVGEPAIRLAGFAGLALLPVAMGVPALWGAAGIALGFAVFMLAASGLVYPHYTMTVLPLLSVGAVGLCLVVARREGLALLAVAALSLVSGGPLRPSSDLAQAQGPAYGAPLSEILAPVEAAFRTGETLILCGLSRRRIPPGAVWLHLPSAGPGKQIYLRRLDLIGPILERAGYRGGPVRGLCRPGELAAVAPYLDGLSESALPGGWVQWTAARIAPSPIE